MRATCNMAGKCRKQFPRLKIEASVFRVMNFTYPLFLVLFLSELAYLNTEQEGRLYLTSIKLSPFSPWRKAVFPFLFKEKTDQATKANRMDAMLLIRFAAPLQVLSGKAEAIHLI